ncbi:hypothetical protein [Nocardia sp. NPDC019255]|uniref:hypothetical protein n=1 Tax=Nocardia sp. NPDC019255 TaxID=3154591 RepID=UPI003409D4E2
MSRKPYMGDEDDPFNLVEIERQLAELGSTNGKAALTLKQWRMKLAEANKALREAKYKATDEAPEGTVQMKNAYVDRKTNELQHAVELAKIQVQYGMDLVEERKSARSALQTRANIAREAMRLAGYGGGA